MKTKYTVLIVGIIVSAMALLSCSNFHKKSDIHTRNAISENPLLVEFNELNPFADLNANHISSATDITLKKSQIALDAIINLPKDQRNFQNTILAQDDIWNLIGRVEYPIYLLNEVHPDSIIRAKAEKSILKFSEWQNEMSLNEDLYQAVVEFSESSRSKNMKKVEQRLLKDILDGFIRQGFNLSKAKRDSVKAIKNRIQKIGLEFGKNISTYTDTLTVGEQEMLGLPDWYKDKYHVEDGVYKLDISYPTRRTFMRLSDSEEARKKYTEKFLNRAADTNLDVIKQLVIERQNLAKVLGYRSYAEYLLEDRMPKNPETVWKFEEDLNTAIKAKTDKELKELLEIKTKMTGKKAKSINYWELHYFTNLLQEEKYQLDSEVVSEYFELNNVRKGLFDITQSVFGLSYKEVTNPSVWHKDVELFEVYDNSTNALLGYFYLDLYPRENKYSHAAHFGIAKGKMTENGYQKPIAALVCNFPKPAADQPSLLQHGAGGNVETFFHEFGHLIHGMVTTAEYFTYSGTGVDRDFVEAPSQIFENWVWYKKSLRLFAKHYKTGEVIPDELLDKMFAAKNMTSGGDMAFQVLLGMEDMTLYDRWDPNGTETVLDVSKRLHKKILNWNETPNTARIASFGHLDGYAASYYGYAWSRVFSADMFSIFDKEGILNPRVGKRFRDEVLAKGGTEDPMYLVENFIGRKPNNEALLKSLGL